MNKTLRIKYIVQSDLRSHWPQTREETKRREVLQRCDYAVSLKDHGLWLRVEHSSPISVEVPPDLLDQRTRLVSWHRSE